MNQSIFKNFDPQLYGYETTEAIDYAGSPLDIRWVEMLLIDGILACREWMGEAAREEEEYRFLNNSEFKKINELFLNLIRLSCQRFGEDVERCGEEFDRKGELALAMEGFESSQNPEISKVQIYGLSVLWNIESAINKYNEYGWCEEVTEQLLYAAHLTNELRDVQNDEIDELRVRKAADIRHKGNRLIRTEALRIYTSKNNWKSRRAAAKEIVEQIRPYASLHGVRLSADRELQTVYEWLSAHDKQDQKI